MKNKLLLESLLLPGIAYAHGAEILEPILSQFAILLIIISYIIFSSHSLKNKAKLFLGLIAGIMCGWLSTIGIDYTDFLEHHILFTTFVSICPLISTFITYKLINKTKK
jgi:hypothetical protein